MYTTPRVRLRTGFLAAALTLGIPAPFCLPALLDNPQKQTGALSPAELEELRGARLPATPPEKADIEIAAESCPALPAADVCAMPFDPAAFRPEAPIYDI